MPVWNELKTDAEIENFLHLFGGFHDGCLKEAHIWGGHFVDSELSMQLASWLNMRALFQRQWKDPSAVELVFQRVSDLWWRPSPPGHEDVIFDAWIYRREDVIVWADAPPGEPAKKLVAADRLWWRDASDWMGSDLRLGPEWNPED